ncbi:hypothetical protein GGI35DRAFT_291402 [Trichoderma velutinum]
MPYVIRPEQNLVRILGSELYANLVGFRKQMPPGPSWIISTIPTLELDDSPEGEYSSHKWCSVRQMRVTKIFEECNEVNECLWFLRKGLETYENLRSHRPNRRKRCRNCTAAYIDSDSDSIMGSDEAEATSDEESLAITRKQQAVRKMETRVRELIQEFKQKYPQW